MGKTSCSDTAEPTPSPTDRSGEVGHPDPLDIVVLLSIAVFLVLSPPDLQYLSYRYGHGSQLSRDVFGGALTGLSVLLLPAYFLVAMTSRAAWARTAKLLIVVGLAVMCVLLPTVSDVMARHDRDPQIRVGQVSIAHDGGVLQTEAAIGFLLQGRSPYSADYSVTEMAEGRDSHPELWRSLGFEENPAYHFYPYPPFTLLLSLPFCLASHAVIGWFDQRMVYVVAWAVLAVLAYRLPAAPRWRLPLMALLVFNPIAAMFFVPGRNDILCQVLLAATLFLLTRRHTRSSAVLLGLSCGVKQFAWLLVPFYLAHLYSRAPEQTGRSRCHRLARLSWPLLLSAGVVMVPFLVWDPTGFLHGLVVAQGSVYPFRSNSLGVANFLILFEAIQSYRDRFPLLAFEVFIVLPVCAYGVRRVFIQRTVSSMLVWYAVTLLLFLFFGRHFAHNYLAVVFSMMAMAWAVAHDEAQRSAPPTRD